MKKLTPVILAVALALSILGVLGTRIYQAAAYGGAAPEILFDSEVISVPTGADDAALLAGVTATDAEDGDVTASLVVEGISGRNDDGTVRVTYAVFDSNHHVTKATRAVRYTDYVKPRFALTQPLVCRTGGNRVLSSYVTAHDSIDGDLSGRVKIALTDGSSLAISGTHTAELRVTNSIGDTASVPVTGRGHGGGSQSCAHHAHGVSDLSSGRQRLCADGLRCRCRRQRQQERRHGELDREQQRARCV